MSLMVDGSSSVIVREVVVVFVLTESHKLSRLGPDNFNYINEFCVRARLNVCINIYV